MKNIKEVFFSSNPKIFLFWVAFLTILIRSILPLFFPQIKLINEMAVYDELARNLLKGDGFITYWHNIAYRALLPPGYSVFLAFFYLLGFKYLHIRFIQALLTAICGIIIYLIGKQLYDEKIARLAAFLFAIYPQSVILSDLLLTETLFVFLFLLGIFFTIKTLEHPEENISNSFYKIILAGLFLGLAALTRSITAYFLPFCIICFLFLQIPRKALLKIVLITFFSFLVILPWSIRNAIILNDFILINSKSGIDFFLYNHSSLAHILANTADPTDEKALDASVSSEVEHYQKSVGMAKNWILKHPFLFIFKGIRMQWNLWGLERCFFTHLKEGYWQKDGELGGFPSLAVLLITPYLVLPFVIFLPLLIIGAIRTFPITRKQTAAWIPYLLVLYWSILSFLAYSFYRQRYPLLPFLILWASWSLVNFSELRQHLKPSSWRWSEWVTIFITFFFIVGWLLDFIMSFDTIKKLLL